MIKKTVWVGVCVFVCGTAFGAGDGSVEAPRVYLEAHRALSLAGKAAGQKYAVSVRELDGLVGPLTVGGRVAAKDLMERVAKATDTELSWKGGIAVFQPFPSDGLEKAVQDLKSPDRNARRRAVYALGETQRLEAIESLCGALGDKDPSVSFGAALALASLEGDFAHNEWPGRVSVFELPGLKLDLDSLLWLIEDEAARGGREWNAAVSVLARARERQLPRAIWMDVWAKRKNTIIPCIWAMGRCGDSEVKSTLAKRIRNTFTNQAGDRYAVGAALGKLGMLDILDMHAFGDRRGKTPEIRGAVAYGLGFAQDGSKAAVLLEKMLVDSDSRVRELAVFSLGELNTDKAVRMLSATLADGKADILLRAAAARALGRTTVPDAVKLLAAAAQQNDNRLRIAAAEALGDLGGRAAIGILQALVKINDRWVKASAVRSLAAINGRAEALLTDPNTDVEVKVAAAIGLGQSRVPAAAGPLVKAAMDPANDRRLREYAVRSLAMLANRAGQPALKQLIEAESPVRMTVLPLRHLDLGDDAKMVEYVSDWIFRGKSVAEKISAVECVGEAATEETANLLTGGSDVFHNHARWTHVWYLIRSRSSIVRKRLIYLLKNSRRSGVRTNAALALVGRQDPDAIDALISACGDPVSLVRKSAAVALGETGSPLAARPLIRLMERDDDMTTAHQALRSLRRHDLVRLPQVQEAFAAVKGTERDCGVPGGGSRGDNSWVLSNYAADVNDLTVPNLTYESSMAYDSVKGQTVQWGAHGRRSDAPQTGMTWILDARTLSWRRPVPRQEPPATCCNRGPVFDPVRRLFISPKSGMGGHGWTMYLRKNVTWSVPWVFDTSKEEWYPMRPMEHTGGGYSQVPDCFDTRSDVMLIPSSRAVVYDAHRNRWEKMAAPRVAPPSLSNGLCAYDPVTGRAVMAGGQDEKGRMRTWAYDLSKNAWAELEAKNAPAPMRGGVMVYDSANDVMIALVQKGPRIATAVYHLREGRWEEPMPSYPAPCYHQFDAVYDPIRNATVITGGWEWGQSGSIPARETWTYRYKSGGKRHDTLKSVPRDLKLDVTKDGKVVLSWKAPEDGAPNGYSVYRADGKNPWSAEYTRIGKTSAGDTTFTVTGKTGACCFRVCSVLDKAKEGLPGNVVRTVPLPVREISASRAADGAVALSWLASGGPGVIGYNIYRAPAKEYDPWKKTFDPKKIITGELAKVNEKPVEEIFYTDRPGGPAAACSELKWGGLFIYVVRAVNSLGLESGNSPATLSIPGTPGPVIPVRLGDGRTLVVSGAIAPAALAGYSLYRLDSYRGDHVYRMKGAPQTGTVFVDDEAWPAGDRRSYFVIARDEMGQMGVPSTPGWAINMP